MAAEPLDSVRAIYPWLFGSMCRFRTLPSLRSLARSLFQGDSVLLQQLDERLQAVHEDFRSSEAHRYVEDEDLDGNLNYCCRDGQHF